MLRLGLSLWLRFEIQALTVRVDYFRLAGPELKVGRVSLFRTKPERFAVRNFQVVTTQNKDGFWWPGTKTGRLVVMN